ncbi:MAG: hypothetical protein CMJ18_24895 [Phycisphaeraceae bacterium]|nr:hypothetical protein [Phycisphaeraceae bacterium]
MHAHLSRWGWAGVLLLALFASAPVHASDDVRFLTAFERTRTEPDRAPEIWQAFIEPYPKGDLAALARLMTAVHLVRKGAGQDQVDGALASIRQGDDEGRALRRHVHRAALAMAARRQMRSLVGHLQAYYRRHVAYPAALSDLATEKVVAPAMLVDPFGAPYDYAARARRLMPDVERQAFTLRCGSVGIEHEDLDRLIDQSRQPVRALVVDRVATNRDYVLVRVPAKDGTPGRAHRWKIGARMRGLTLWYASDRFLVVGWKELPRVMVVREPRMSSDEAISR